MTEPGTSPADADARLAEARRLNDAGAGLLGEDRPQEAVPLFVRGVALTREVDSSCDLAAGEVFDLRATLLINLAVAIRSSGDLGAAVAHLDEAVVLATGVASRRTGTVVVALSVRALTLCALGHTEEALNDLDAAAHHLACRTSADTGGFVDRPGTRDPDFLNISLHNARCEVFLAVGRWTEAHAEADLALATAMATHPELAGHPYTNLAAVAQYVGDHLAAQAYLSLANEIHDLVGEATAIQLSTENLARTALLRGDLDAASNGFDRAAELAVAADLPTRAAACRVGLAAVCRALGDPAKAAEILDGALAELSGTGRTEALALRAEIAVDLGDPATAQVNLLAARELTTSPFDSCRVDVRRGELLALAAASMTGEEAAAGFHAALNLVVPATLVIDALRTSIAPGPFRERWITQVAAPSMCLVFSIATTLQDTALILDLMGYASATAFSIAAAVQDSTAPVTIPGDGRTGAVRPGLPSLPPRIVLVPGGAVCLDAWITLAERRYAVPLRSPECVAAW